MLAEVGNTEYLTVKFPGMLVLSLSLLSHGLSLGVNSHGLGLRF